MLNNALDVIFLVGAGFSKPAYVPLMSEFVVQFEERMKGIGKKHYGYFYAVKDMMLEASDKKQVDLEILMDILQKLAQANALGMSAWREKRVISKFKREIRLDVKNGLEELIRLKCVIDPDTDLKYLEPIIRFTESSTLDIFSVNYDDVVEVFCHQYQYNLEDGFALYWEPERFQRENVHIHLFKLHGSVLWYKTDQGTFYKILLKAPEKSELISGEKLESLIAYPVVGKPIHTAPLAFAMSKLRERLEQVHTCVVIGYSMRDSHIKDIFVESLRRNPKLKIVIAIPNPFETIENEITSVALKRACIPVAFTVQELLANDKLWHFKNEVWIGKSSAAAFDMSPQDETREYFKSLEYVKAMQLMRSKLAKREYKITLGHPNYLHILGGLSYVCVVGRFTGNKSLENEAREYLIQFLRQAAKRVTNWKNESWHFLDRSKEALKWLTDNLKGTTNPYTQEYVNYKTNVIDYASKKLSAYKDESEIKKFISEIALVLVKWKDERIGLDRRKYTWLYE